MMAEEVPKDLTDHGVSLNSSSDFGIDDSSVDNTSRPSKPVSEYGHETIQDLEPACPEHSDRLPSEHNDLVSESLPSHQLDDESVQQGRNLLVEKSNYDRLSQENSDHEDADEASDHCREGSQIRNLVPEANKSLYCENGDGLGGDSDLHLEKPRQSLFGDAAMEDEEHPLDKTSTVESTEGPMEIVGPEFSSRSTGVFESPLNPGIEPGTPAPDTGSSTSPNSPVPSEDSCIQTSLENQPTYELRKNIERKKAFTHIDNDMSGNFDPSDETRQRILKLNKAKAGRAAKAAQQQKQKKGRKENRALKKHIRKLIVRLRFEAFGNVRNLTNDEQNWPDNWSDISSECERERQKVRSFFRSNTPGVCTQTQIDDPCNEIDDLTGRPEVRGCKSCRKNRDHCSLVQGGKYPCIQCADATTICELIIPARTKGCCKQCVQDGVERCSFADEPDKGVCNRCVDGDFVCEALPPKGYRADRINIDELVYGEDRPHRACTVCRQEKKRCSLKKSDKPPCKSCKKKHIGCTFFDVPKQEPIKKATEPAGGNRLGRTDMAVPEAALPISSYLTAEDLAEMEDLDEATPSREATPEIEMEDNDGNKGILKKILTSFAHPIQFGVESSSDCNFCQMPLFGITGEYEREVHVICWYNGLGYTEVGGGHCEDRGATRMCHPCTTQRFQIAYCSSHDIKLLAEADNVMDFESVANDLLSTEPGPGMESELRRWCSLCFSVAKFGCALVQPSLSSEEGEREINITGCGLRLCERCEDRLKQDFAGDMDLMVDAMDQESKIGIRTRNEDVEGIARADVGLLRKGGLLVRNVIELESPES